MKTLKTHKIRFQTNKNRKKSVKTEKCLRKLKKQKNEQKMFNCLFIKSFGKFSQSVAARAEQMN